METSNDEAPLFHSFALLAAHCDRDVVRPATTDKGTETTERHEHDRTERRLLLRSDNQEWDTLPPPRQNRGRALLAAWREERRLERA